MSLSPIKSPGVSGASSSLSEYSRVDSAPGEWPAVIGGKGVGGLSSPAADPTIIPVIIPAITSCGSGEVSSGTVIEIGEDGWALETGLGLGLVAGEITTWALEATSFAISSVVLSVSE